jgi:hypothetical protein
MVWLYRSPIPVGRRGVLFSFKLFLPAFATHTGRGEGGGILCSHDINMECNYLAWTESKLSEQKLEYLSQMQKVNGFSQLYTVFRIRIRKFSGLPKPDRVPLVRGTDPDPDPDPPIIKQKY